MTSAREEKPVLLVRPHIKKKYSLNVTPPLGLGYLASALRKHGLEVAVLDLLKEKGGPLTLVEIIQKYHPRIVGFQYYSLNTAEIEECINIIKGIDSDIKVVLGGPHPSALPEETLKRVEKADFAFIGEGERGFPMLCEAIKGKKAVFSRNIPGLVWRENGKVLSNPPLFENDLDSFEFPAWDLMAPRSYPEAVQGVFFRNLPAAPIIATRGCPHVCTFCAGFTISGRKVRARSARNFMEEVQLLHDRYGVRELKILDDNFTFYRSLVEDICHIMIEKGPNISWNCPNGMRMDKLDKKLVKLMKRAGCYEVTLGIESGSDTILEHMKKRLKTSDIRRYVGIIQTAGLPVSGLFIIGYPAETREDIEKTIRFARELKLVRAEFNNFIPLPRSEAYERLLAAGKKIDLEKLYFSKVPVPPPGLSERDVKRLQRRAFLSFYLRPSTLWRQIREIKTAKQIWVIFKRALSYLG